MKHDDFRQRGEKLLLLKKEFSTVKDSYEDHRESLYADLANEIASLFRIGKEAGFNPNVLFQDVYHRI